MRFGQYHIGTQLIAFIVIAPYMSIGKWKPIFETPKQHRFVPHTWYADLYQYSCLVNDVEAQVLNIPSDLSVH